MTSSEAVQTIEAMAYAERAPDPPEERLTWQEICRRYPNEWVALAEVDWLDDVSLEFRSAIVAGHGPRRTDPLDQTRSSRSRYPSMAHYFTGAVGPR